MPRIQNNSANVTAGINTGVPVKKSFRWATTAALPAVTYDNGVNGVGATITAVANGVIPDQDGVVVADGDRGVIQDQAAGLQNGYYKITTKGTAGTKFVLTRTVDADQDAEFLLKGSVSIAEGDLHGNTMLTTSNIGAIDVGTTDIQFEQATISFINVRIGKKEYPDINSAVVEALSGQTVIVPRGTYAEGDLFSGSTVSDFNMHFEVGAIVNAPASAKAIFDTTSCPGGIFTGKITGNGVFDKATDASVTGIIFTSNASVDMYFEALNVENNGNIGLWCSVGKVTARIKGFNKSTNGTPVFADTGGEIIYYGDLVEEEGNADAISTLGTGKITAYVNKIVNSGSGNGVISYGGSINVFADSIEVTGSAGTAVRTTTAGGEVNVRVDAITGVGLRVIENSGLMDINARIISHNNNQSSIVNELGATMSIHDSIIENVNTGATGSVISNNGTLLLDNCRLTRSTTSSTGVFNSAEGTATLKNTSVKNTGAGKAINSAASNAVLELISCNVEGNSTSEIISISNGVVELRNTKLNQDGVGAGSHGILKSGGTLILDQSKIVLGNTAAFDVSAAAAQNIKNMSSYTNSATKDADITELIEAVVRSSDVE